MDTEEQEKIRKRYERIHLGGNTKNMLMENVDADIKLYNTDKISGKQVLKRGTIIIEDSDLMGEEESHDFDDKHSNLAPVTANHNHSHHHKHSDKHSDKLSDSKSVGGNSTNIKIDLLDRNAT